MQLSFPANKQTELTFKVGIAGTSSIPQSVQVVLERDSTILSFAAKSLNDEWVAVIENPGKVFTAGPVKVCINVVLNNHMFTPMKATADIVEDVKQEVEQEVVQEPTVEPAIEQPEVEIEITPEVPAVKPEEKKQYESLLKVVEKAQPKKEAPALAKAPAKTIPKAEVPAVIKPTFKPAPKIEEKVEITQPIKMQLLKSIEPGLPTRTVVKVVESASPKQKETLFKLKRSKIIFK